MPVSRCGTLSMSSWMPTPPLDAISTEEEVRPAAPMSWIATMASDAISSRHASISSFSVKGRSEEHTSELQSLMRISYAVFCLKKKKKKKQKQYTKPKEKDINNI